MKSTGLLVLPLALLIGCATRDDSISQAERTEKDRPSFAETRAIAEEGFIYGLPIVMNYAVLYEFNVDKTSGQYKAPFNEINNEARVFTYKDTAIVTPNSDTPYSILAMDLRAEPIVLSVPAVEKARYYSVMLVDGNTFNYGYIGSRATAFPKVDKELVKTNFFEYLDFALHFAPPGPEEQAIRAKLARIGVGPEKSFDFKELSLEHKAEVVLGMKAGDAKVNEAVKTLGKKVNGWNISSAFGDRTFYHGDWLKRAAAARAGIYGNDAVEAAYPMARVDADGEVLDGSKRDYTLTFPKGQLPPVSAFWSVTMYDGKSQLLIQNPINRYLINSPMLGSMKRNADGSLTLYIQNKSPGKAKESNWLPAPNGPIYLVMRLYWPKETPPSVLPPGEGTWQPPGVKRAS